MKIIYRELKSAGLNSPYVMVKLFYPITLDSEIPYDFPAVLVTEIGKYHEDENSERTFKMLPSKGWRDSVQNQPQAIREAIKTLDETYDLMMAKAVQPESVLDPRD
jgi:hypothetical protein